MIFKILIKIDEKAIELEYNLLNGLQWTNGYWATVSVSSLEKI